MIPLSVEQFEWLIFGGICLIPIAFFIIGILLCVWVYRDAESRGMNGALWLVIVLIGSIVGLIVYLIVRKEKQGPPGPAQVTRVCTGCGRAVSTGVKFCPHCGKELPE